jgi:molybdopterin-dependent oxidoreductase alpha subunit
MTDQIQAHTPPEIDTPDITSQATSAAGPKAIYQVARHVWSKAGIIRGTGALLRVNQKGGFDCPGCAWPEHEQQRHTFEFCENGAKAVAEEATTALADAAFFAQHTLAALSAQSDYWLGLQGRLAQPMYLPKNATHYQPIGWDQALDLITTHLRALSKPDQAIFYGSGRMSNEAAFLYQLLARCFGTNNLPDSSNMCHESSSVGLKEVIGIGKSTVSLDDFDHADVILIMGQNPGTNHPRMLATLSRAAKRGCYIISVNPLHEAGLDHFKDPKNPLDWITEGTAISSQHVPIRINGDVAFLKGVMKYCCEHGHIDKSFVVSRTAGFEDFHEALRQVSWRDIENASGLTRETITAAATRIAASQRLIVCWAMGLTQHVNAVSNIQEIVNLLLLGGHFGRPGAGVCPVRGHSNVQGDRTMGITVDPDAAFLQLLKQNYKFTPPAARGLDVVSAIHAMHQGKATVFIGLGGNFLSATPDTDYTATALRRCALTVHISTKLNRSHLVTGQEALILPCLGRSEIDQQTGGAQSVTTENSMGYVTLSQGHLAPASSFLRSEVAIVAELGARLLGDTTPVDWRALSGDYAKIRAEIGRVIAGFENANAQLRQHGGFSLPNAVRDQGQFNVAQGKAKFTVHALPEETLLPDQFILMTIRSHDQFNTTIYGLDDRYRGIFNGRRVVFMNATDMQDMGFTAGQRVDITSHFGDERRTVDNFMLVAYNIPRRCLAAYYPETNPLIPIGLVAKKSFTPASKSIVVTLHPSLVEPGSKTEINA